MPALVSHAIATLILALSLSLAACGDTTKEHAMPDLANVRANLAFTCVHEAEHLPPLPLEADRLFQYARWLQKNNLLKEDPAVDKEVARLYRIAAAHGHYKANFNVQNGISAHKFDGSTDEMLDLNEALMKANIPVAYYNLGHFLENGMGVKEDHELALKYFRKSADLGNPHAQYYVAEKLAPIDVAPDVARQMRRCAAGQGHGKAALGLGSDLQLDKLYAEAVKAYQLGVKAGDSISAWALHSSFNGPAADDELNYLALQKDPERSRRYKAIGKVLGNYSYLNPTVPEIDDIVPLPPAKLPPWDGKLQWLKEHEANVPPAKPDDELIQRLSRDKGLDPATGRALAGKHK